ncbi:MAG: hypothetical protein P9M14_07705 [Candidatus Alcyoniella australis]|nr:hypothetical protein [Candidatus Alcyoniella australis]
MLRKQLSIVLGLSLLAACLCAPAMLWAGEQDNATLDQVQADRKAAEELLIKQSEMAWLSYTQGEASDQAALYREYGYLFQPERIAATKRAIELTVDPVQRKALQWFSQYQQEEYIWNQTALLYDIYMDMEANLMVTVEGEATPYRELHRILGAEPDPARRFEIAKAEYQAYKLFNETILRRDLETSQRLARELGFDSYLDMALRHARIDPKQTEDDYLRWLEISEPLYFELWDKVSPIKRSEFHRSDILFLLSGSDFDQYFPKGSALPLLKKTLAGMGIVLDEQTNILIDDRELEKKVPRAACFSIRVPNDIRVNVKPVGGKDDFSSLFHEFGHAEHFAHSQTPVWEFQQLGDNAVTESYAYLFEGLPENRIWIEDNIKMSAEDLERYMEYVAFSRLYMSRRYCAKTVYEIRLLSGVDNPQEEYRTLMSRAYGFELTSEEALRYLSDVDPLLYASSYAQAFFLEAMLSATLEKKFGARWWLDGRSGEFMAGLWAFGNELSGPELASKLGYSSMEPQMLLSYIQAMLPKGR